jgi:hypothetical protein
VPNAKPPWELVMVMIESTRAKIAVKMAMRIMWPKASRYWRRASDVKYETPAQSRRPVNVFVSFEAHTPHLLREHCKKTRLLCTSIETK